MDRVSSIDQETKEDIYFGQVVIIGARWFLIATGIIMLLWTTMEYRQPGALVLGVLPLLGLMGINFFLHGSYLLGRPMNPGFILMTGALDLVVVTLLVALWPGQAGLDNHFFIFYYPVVLAFALSMPRKMEVAFTVVAIIAYTAVVAPHFHFDTIVSLQHDVKSLLIRLIALGAMGGLGNYYFRIYRRGRRTSVGAGNQG